MTSDQLEYDVIEKGSSGFLGIGAKQAVISARRKKTAEAPVELEEIKLRQTESETRAKKRREASAGSSKEGRTSCTRSKDSRKRGAFFCEGNGRNNS